MSVNARDSGFAGGTTVMTNATVALPPFTKFVALPTLLMACTDVLNRPLVVGVPDTSPVTLFRVKPAGSEVASRNTPTLPGVVTSGRMDAATPRGSVFKARYENTGQPGLPGHCTCSDLLAPSTP